MNSRKRIIIIGNDLSSSKSHAAIAIAAACEQLDYEVEIIEFKDNCNIQITGHELDCISIDDLIEHEKPSEPYYREHFDGRRKKGGRRRY